MRPQQEQYRHQFPQRVPRKCILSRRQRAVSRVQSLHLQYFPRRLPLSRLHHPQLQLPRQMSRLSRQFPPSSPALPLCLQSLRHGSYPKYRDLYVGLRPTSQSHAQILFQVSTDRTTLQVLDCYKCGWEAPRAALPRAIDFFCRECPRLVWNHEYFKTDAFSPRGRPKPVFR